MINALSIDVEDYFQVSAFSTIIPRTDWNLCTSRVGENTRKILRVLDKKDVRATFFVLGWTAKCHPTLISLIRDRGHEIASHGYDHKLITEQSPKGFARDLKRSIDILEGITGERVGGYRAPSYSVTPETLWAIDIIKSCGFEYDSSVFPIVHDLGGFPNAPRHPYEIKEDLWEFPLSTFRLLGKNWPVAGGGYLRLYPYWFTKWIIERLNKRGQPAVVYVHPWEFDPDQPRFDDAPLLSRFRHYQNLDKTEKKLKALFRDFEFAPIKDVLDNWISQNG